MFCYVGQMLRQPEWSVFLLLLLSLGNTAKAWGKTVKSCLFVEYRTVQFKNELKKIYVIACKGQQ